MSDLASNVLSSNNAAPLLFDPIDRADADVPEDFMPWAQVALCASHELVRRATEECPPFSRRRRWRTQGCRSGEAWINIAPDCILSVMQVGKLWFVYRRFVRHGESGRPLAYVFGPQPICTNTCDEAMRLAEYFHFTPAKDAGGVVWVDQ